MDTYKSEIVRVDRLATGGKEDGLAYGTHPRNVLDHCGPAEFPRLRLLAETPTPVQQLRWTLKGIHLIVLP